MYQFCLISILTGSYFKGRRVFKSTSRAFAIDIIVNKVGLPTPLSIIFTVSSDIPALVARFNCEIFILALSTHMFLASVS